MLGEQPTQIPASVAEFPQWIAGEDMDSMERAANRLASTALEKKLQVERSLEFGASLALMELNDHSRRENRWLAARCLGYVGDFSPLVAVLNDADHPPVWTDEAIEHLRAAVARSAETAVRVREALQKQYGQDAPSLYRMLWGYTVDGLRGDRQAEELVEYLDHQTLAMRILSFWNLREIFGLGLLYRPTDREAVRRAHSQKWKQRIGSRGIWTKLLGEPETAPAAPENTAPAAAKNPADQPPPPVRAEQQP
jgi:hypothetical protein